jgi:hypothetical protein
MLKVLLEKIFNLFVIRNLLQNVMYQKQNIEAKWDLTTFDLSNSSDCGSGCSSS